MVQCVPFNSILRAPSDIRGAEWDQGLTGGAAIGQVIANDDAFHVEALDEFNAFSFIEVPPAPGLVMLAPRGAPW